LFPPPAAHASGGSSNNQLTAGKLWIGSDVPNFYFKLAAHAPARRMVAGGVGLQQSMSVLWR
jgi:hypothetical protein